MTSPTVKSVVKAIDAAVTAVTAARERVSDQAVALAAERDAQRSTNTGTQGTR